MPRRVRAVGQLRRAELRALTSSDWWRATMVLGPLLAGTLAAVAIPVANVVATFLLVVGAAAIGGGVGTYLLADSRAKSAFVRAWASSRGWTTAPGPWLDEATPLLRAGDRRDSIDHVSGPLTGDSQAVLCHYTYEVKHTNTSSQGTATTSWEEHRFTVVEVRVATPDISALSLHPRTFGDNRLFDRIDSALTANRVVRLESSQLGDEYKLEVADDASDVALRLFFEPTFIVWCLDQASDEMLIEIENDTLVVAIPEHSYDAAELDDLVAKAATVADRLADTRVASETVT